MRKCHLAKNEIPVKPFWVQCVISAQQSRDCLRRAISNKGFPIMTTTVKIGAAIMLMFSLASCANTIRGVGRDAANTVNATQDAGRTVDHAAKR
jgi:predicted small secreted protein